MGELGTSCAWVSVPCTDGKPIDEESAFHSRGSVPCMSAELSVFHSRGLELSAFQSKDFSCCV